MKHIVIATSQFDVTHDVARNAATIREQIFEAAASGARVVLFPECALTGYRTRAGLTETDFQWATLEAETRSIRTAAAKAGVWTVLGTVHRQESAEKPRNSVVIIDDGGAIVGRYDKRRLWGRDNEHYSTGTEPTVVCIDGVPCGFLICFDSCFPELYAEYRRRGVEVLFHSFFNAGNSDGETDLDNLIFCQQVTRAADHGLWIVASNSSSPHSRLAAGFFGPDGSVKALNKNAAGVITTTLPPTRVGWTYGKCDTHVVSDKAQPVEQRESIESQSQEDFCWPYKDT